MFNKINHKQQHNFNELVNMIYQTHEALKNYALKYINVSLTVINWLFGFYNIPSFNRQCWLNFNRFGIAQKRGVDENY